MAVEEAVVAVIKTSAMLANLTLAALALPGLMPDLAQAGRVEETYNTDFQYGHYSESGNRISVDIFENAISIPLGQSMTGSVSVVRDVISGASPMYNKRLNAQDSNSPIVQMLSGASQCGFSICEQRDAITSGLTYFWESASASLSGGYSREHDYTSRYVGLNLSLELNKKLTTLNFGSSVAFDEVQPSYLNGDCGEKCHKTSQQYLLGVTQVIDKDSLLLSNMTFSYNKGYLSDPYKLVAFYSPDDSYVENPSQPGHYQKRDPSNPDNVLIGYDQALQPIQVTSADDRRPNEKFQWAWLTQYVRHFESVNSAALHVDYRFTTDSWGVNSHTTELSWHQPIADDWQIIPRFRYYSQDAADFYQPVFTGNPENYKAYSSDYRLAGFGTISGGIKISKSFNEIKPLTHLKFQAGIEYYDHKASYQLGGSSNGSFADFSYYLVTASFNLKF
jgi:hypothetical protein